MLAALAALCCPLLFRQCWVLTQLWISPEIFQSQDGKGISLQLRFYDHTALELNLYCIRVSKCSFKNDF